MRRNAARDDAPTLLARAADPRTDRRWLASARIGPGALIDEDVRIGAENGRTSTRPVSIGRDARIRGGSSIAEGVTIGDRLETGRNVLIGANTTLGDDCRIQDNAVIESECVVGARVRVSTNCVISSFSSIADDVAIAAGACLANDPHPGSTDHACMRGPTIERGAQIGMNATILPFVTIGERAVVGAGSVVTRDAPAELVVAGNPARVLKSVSEITCPLDLDAGDYLRAPKRASERPSPVAQNGK